MTIEDLKKSWLQDRLVALNAVYHKFGRDGLKDEKLSDVSLLLASKEMEFRDTGQADPQRRELELEIKDLTGYVNVRLAAANIRAERPRQEFKPKDKSFHRER